MAISDPPKARIKNRFIAYKLIIGWQVYGYRIKYKQIRSLGYPVLSCHNGAAAVISPCNKPIGPFFVDSWNQNTFTMDDKNKRGGSDRKRIDISEDYEVRDWSEKFNVSKEKLKEAVEAVGTYADEVEKYLKK